MTWSALALIAVCVLISDAIFMVLAHRYVRIVHAREAAFRLRDDQSNHFPNHSHARLNKSGSEQDHA